VQRRWPSVEKAERLLGWRAAIGVRDGIRATAEWLRRQEEVASA
jgi:UDP-glucose 4-epimerase